MLWQTEPDSDLYIDLLKNITYEIQNFRLHRKKNNDLSLRVRTEGNAKYIKNDFKGAMSKYNESICLAADMEHLSLSYGNRSQCFLKMTSYDRCLNDIRLAKAAGYPLHLSSKLENREIECLKHLDSTSMTHMTTSPLIVNHHDRIDEMANVLRIDNDVLYGRSMKANQDIQTGETLVVEKAYLRIVNDDGSNDCTTCGKTNANFIPCANCADAMFCDKDCADNHFHKDECDIVFGSTNEIDWLAFTLQSVVVAINTFETVEHLIEFVIQCLSTDRFEIPQFCDSSVSKYRMFFKLTCSESNSLIEESLRVAFFVFDAIKHSPNLGLKFEEVAKRRFLVHLIVHHHITLRKNSFGYEKDGAYIHELSLLTSYFNHSCLPNVAKLSKGNESICKSILPIKENEHLFLSYISEEVFNMREKQRNDQLEALYEFRCTCDLCKYGTLRAEGLELDPSFQYVVAQINTANFNDDVITNVILHCRKFIVRHSDMTRSQELHYIADILAAMYSKVING